LQLVVREKIADLFADCKTEKTAWQSCHKKNL